MFRVVKDGDEEHVTVGHTIGDRSHLIEKKRDKTGRTHQKQKFVNLAEGYCCLLLNNLIFRDLKIYN